MPHYIGPIAAALRTPRAFPVQLTGTGFPTIAAATRVPRAYGVHLASLTTVPEPLVARLDRLDPDLGLIAGTEILDASARSWHDRADGPGDGSIDVPLDSASYASIGFDKRDAVTYLYKGHEAFTQRLTSWNGKVRSNSGESQDVMTFTGDGHMNVTSEGLVLPPRGLRFLPAVDDRPFDYTSPVGFDDSLAAGWLPAAQVGTVILARELAVFITGNFVALGLEPPDAPELRPSFWAPDGDPFGGVPLLWQFGGTLGRGQPYPNLCGGTGYFRKFVGIPTTGEYKFWATCCAVGDYFVDGSHLLSLTHQANGHDFLNTGSTTLTLTAGVHLIAWTVSNLPDWAMTNPHWNPAFGGFNIQPTDINAGSYVFDTLRPTEYLWSSGGTRMKVYVPEAPGMTVGQAIQIVVDENKALGFLNYVQLAFDGERDSAGNKWPTVSGITTRVGNDLWTFLDELRQQKKVELWMAPGTTRLYAWIPGGRGRAVAVTLGVEGTDPGVDSSVEEVAVTGEAPVADWVLAKSPLGWEGFGTGRIPALLSLGAASSEAEVARLANEQIGQFGVKREQLTVTHEPAVAAEPYVDFGVYDTITMPGVTGGLVSKRVTAIGVTEDEDGNVTFVTEDPDDGELVLTVEERVGNIFKRDNFGSLGGRSRVASPIAHLQIPPAAVPTAGSPQAPSLFSSPRFSVVDRGASSGAAGSTAALGNPTLGGDAPGTYYFLQVAMQGFSTWPGVPAAPSHPGLTLTEWAGADYFFLGFSAGNTWVYVFTPTATPATAPISLPVTAGAGTQYFSWQLFKASNVKALPGMPSSALDYASASFNPQGFPDSGNPGFPTLIQPFAFGVTFPLERDHGAGYLILAETVPHFTTDRWTESWAWADPNAVANDPGELRSPLPGLPDSGANLHSTFSTNDPRTQSIETSLDMSVIVQVLTEVPGFGAFASLAVGGWIFVLEGLE